ncbi:PadR family transcriptional regulator [Rhodococcus sp. CX]|uniref:PadR family transcriptional regulator n=1 Tax=Rhodococcus sp. CX TaxID=2789880 RepID=UPI001E5B8CF4|nr:helix-turn-helix transcriptional regulator [Rhodococcus sp. CX]
MAIAVLALLEERPMHPYEMYVLLLQRREENLVKLRAGSLYHTVSRLAERNLVQELGIERAGNRPERTTYRITPAGAEAMRTRIAEILRLPVREYPIFPLGLGEAHNLPADEVIALLGERITRLRDNLEELDVIREWVTCNGVPRRYWISLEYLHSQAAHDLEWLEGLVRDLRDGSLQWEDAGEAGHRRSGGACGLGHDWGAALTDEALDALRKGEAVDHNG